MKFKNISSINRRGFSLSLLSSALVGARSSKFYKDLDVLVIGAGLSGLYAAEILSKEGLKVAVIEGNNRLGGRIQSLRHLQGNPEAGGDSILGGYGRVRNLVKDYIAN